MTTASARLAGLPARLRARAAAASLTVPPPIEDANVGRCPGSGDEPCGAVTVDDEPWCEPCADAPHEFTQDPGSRAGFCLCGRIEAIGGYSPVHLGYSDV